jgi:lactate permease
MDQNYTPIADSLAWSAVAASLPILVLLLLIGVLRKPAWIAAVAGLATSLVVAIAVYAMPADLATSSAAMGAAFGLLPIGWIVYWAVVLYRLTLDTGNFEIIKDSIGGLTTDRRLQAILIAFAFGAFIEGAAGFGTPVAVAAAMLTGLGFSPFFAAGICLLANTAPVAFGSIGIPVVTLASVTGLPEADLSAWVGRICAPVSVFIPAYLVLVMGGTRALKGVVPAVVVCGVAFASMQIFMSNFVGPQLVDIVSALAAILASIVLFKVWQPRDHFALDSTVLAETGTAVVNKHGTGRTLLAWSPYLFLVLFVLLWGMPAIDALGTPTIKSILDSWVIGPIRTFIAIPWPGLHNEIMQFAPMVTTPTPKAAIYNLNWLSAAGTACALATVAAGFVLRIGFGAYFRLLWTVLKQLAFSLLTVACVLGLAYVMNYSGAVVTLGMAFAATGALFPFFSGMLGWLGVFLTGSDTSANALFGSLQVVTANSLGYDPTIMAASNSSAGVMGKMISLQSLAVAVAATGMARSQEGHLFRFTIKHSIFLACVMSAIAALYAYLA